jgi:acyl transferase domain-containing protein
VNTLTSPAPNGRVAGCDETVDQLIARVLSGAHQTMESLDTPNEARTILHVAHSFADELATLDPRFDRMQFIKDVTGDPS